MPDKFPERLNQSGFTHYLLMVLILSLAAIIIIGSTTITTSFPQTTQPQVAGIYKLAVNKMPPLPEDNNTIDFKKYPQIATPSADDLSDLEIDVSSVEKEFEALTRDDEKSLNELVKKMESIGIKEVMLEGKDDKIELNISEPESSTSGKGNRIKKQALGKVKIKLFGNTGEKEINIKSEDNLFKFESEGLEFETKLPISIDGESEQLKIETGSGENALRVLPEDALRVLKNKKIMTSTEKMELIENSNKDSFDKLTIKVHGKKEGKILGLIPISADIESEVGGLSGDVLKTSQPAWFKLLSPIIQ